ncbi:MAG: hypothetical protein U0325_08180 [Polyangiales bacterium]
MQHALSLPSVSLSSKRVAHLGVALCLVGAAGVMAQPTARGILALTVWTLVQALLVGLRRDLAALDDHRAAGRRTLSVILGRARTARLVRMVNLEALAFALTAVATGVFSPVAALLAGAAAWTTARALNAQTGA